ncbi:MAG: lysophospholipid acyltransferase family protein [Acidimicrobiia bacterium]|nr:lysophospholipid acyltransferase family protein [Acidimicrobiia bacterium]MDH3399112.1 lysophospholipid acyltransferase family protein [Acidimicrobiia bacterium]
MADGTLRRRLKTIPTFVGGLLVMLTAAPVLLPLIAVADAIRWVVGRHPWMGTRLYCFGLVYLSAETVGLVALGSVWLAAGCGRFRRPLLDWTFAIQQAWAGTLLAAVRGIFGIRIEVEGGNAVSPGPILLMVRHASIVDNLLPAALVSKRHGIRLRYVLKRELLSDPCLDVAGNRLPNYFVARGSNDTQSELAAIRKLADEMGPQDGVLIYPEGTRFTKAKQSRALEKLGKGDPGIFERAQQLRHVLPPRLGGPLALLNAADPADVVVLAHHGLEGFAQLRDIWAGGMVNATIRVEFWRITRTAVPTEHLDQISWLHDVWSQVDTWIDEHHRRDAPT